MLLNVQGVVVEERANQQPVGAHAQKEEDAVDRARRDEQRRDGAKNIFEYP